MSRQACPAWCNRKHTPGGDPRRQRHTRSWRATGDRSNHQVRAAISVGSTRGHALVFFDVDGLPGLATLPTGRGGVLDAADARALALDLLYMADCADREART